MRREGNIPHSRIPTRYMYLHILTHNIRNHWVSGLYPSSGILNIRKHKVKGETHSLLGPIERAILNLQSNSVGLPLHLRTEKGLVCCFVVFRIPYDAQSPSSNPLESSSDVLYFTYDLIFFISEGKIART
jgi:hypothetical protein